MLLKTIARATVSACLVTACSGGGSGSIEGIDEPGGPFSGYGYPGSSIYRNPGVFSGAGSPGVAGTGDVTSLIRGVCIRVHAVCPSLSEDACFTTYQNQWNNLATDCARNSYYAFFTCLMSASITCNSEGNPATESCRLPSLSPCGETSTGGGTTTGSGGTGGNAGGTGGTGGSTGGSGGTGATGGSTGGSGGGGGTGGSTGGTGGGGTGGAAGTGGIGGRGGRDAGRG